MYFKVLEGTPLFERLAKLKEKIVTCNTKAFNLVKELGYSQFMISGHIAGGVSMIKIEGRTPKGWERVSKKRPGYMPKRIPENDQLWQKINKLPTVEPDDLNRIFKYDGDYLNNETNVISLYPATTWGKGYVVVKIPEWVDGYRPVRGMVEITISEYNKLRTKAEAKK